MGVLESAALSVSSSNMAEFESFRHFLQKECGIYLSDNKRYLVDTRVRQIMTRYQFSTLEELLAAALHDAQLRVQVVDAMTTNETYWFRDHYPFEWLQNYLHAAEVHRPRVWSAACSSGQEPFSLSIIADECGVNLDIVATDISPSMLDVARAGSYDNLAMARGLSPQRAGKYFTQLNEKYQQFAPDLCSRIDFRSLNLMNSFSAMGSFDIIFCRNVLIYFDTDLKRDILQRLHCCLKPGGYLFLGASEGIAGLAELYEMINCRPGICYRAI